MKLENQIPELAQEHRDLLTLLLRAERMNGPPGGSFHVILNRIQ
jgi:hypothetical protein